MISEEMLSIGQHFADSFTIDVKKNIRTDFEHYVYVLYLNVSCARNYNNRRVLNHMDIMLGR